MRVQLTICVLTLSISDFEQLNHNISINIKQPEPVTISQIRFNFRCRSRYLEFSGKILNCRLVYCIIFAIKIKKIY